MATKKRTKNTTPLIIEPHPDNYDGYPFITLLQHRQDPLLTIIDNMDNKSIRAYVLDLCGPANVDEDVVITVANHWYNTSKDLYPLSVEFSRRGISGQVSDIYRKYNIDFVSRLIGPLVRFPINDIQSTKRRRRKEVPNGMEVANKVVKLR